VAVAQYRKVHRFQSKFASKVVNIAASKKMNSFADDDLRRPEINEKATRGNSTD
jgi:hypothetical protein